MRVRTPTIIQMESVESGAAALGIILGYYGKFVTLEQLRVACGISRDGSLSVNILKVARQYGLEANEATYSLSQLKKLPTPFIINWHYNHYVVVEGIKKNKIYLNDPAMGPRKVTWDEMEANFTGSVLTFSPTLSFQREGKQNTFFQSLFSRFRGNTSSLAYLFLAGLLLLIPGIALPTFSQFFVDEILVLHLTRTAPIFIFALLFSTLLAGILTALQGYFLTRLNGKLSIRLSSHFLWHILRLPVEFYAQRYGGEIAYRLILNDKVVSNLTVEIARSFINLLLIVAYGALMFVYDPLVALIGIAAAAFNFAVMLTVNRARTDANIRLQQDMGKRIGMSIGGLQNIESLKAVSAESDFFSRWSGFFAKTMNSMQKIGKFDIFLTITPPFTQFIAAASVLTIGGLRVIRGEMTLGMLLGLQTLMQTFLLPISQFIFLGQRVQNVQGGLNRLDDVLSNPLEPNLEILPEEKGVEAKLKGELELKEISFGYNKLAPPLVENFNLHIKPGQSIALVGPSGCGKTTIARLVTGLYHPWYGQLLFDKMPRENISRNVMTRSVASVDQQIFLFEGSVKDNLTLWDETLPTEEMTQAAQDAYIHSDIIQREDGYETKILEGGLNFSGGQQQRLEIARVLALNPTLLILDEATSALDTETEEKILKKIRQRGCSCLVIAHRLSTIRDCDEIIILEKGQIIARGTHEILKEMSPFYQELIKFEGAQT